MAHAEALILYKYDACIQKKWDKQGERERESEKEKNDGIYWVYHACLIEMQCFPDHGINISERDYQYIINQTISNQTKCNTLILIQLSSENSLFLQSLCVNTKLILKLKKNKVWVSQLWLEKGFS